MRFVPLLTTMVVLVSLASCNSLSKEECVAADWQVIGDTDGAAGFDPQERFANHVKSCARVKIVPDQTKWYEGYRGGIQRYCTPLSGLTHGEAGDGYHNVCPPETEPAFMRGYGLGRKSYELRSRMNSLLSDISVKEMEIDRLYDEMKNTADDLKRRSLRDEIDQLDRDTRRARRDADDIEYQLGAVQRDIDWFRMNPQATLPMPGY